jgi:hypothetical protein
MKEWMAYEYKMGISMTECFKTPVYVRRFRIDVFHRLREEAEESSGENESVAVNGKRKSKVSGEELKAKLKNNEINLNDID